MDDIHIFEPPFCIDVELDFLDTQMYGITAPGVEALEIG